jgi:hypothetical protein
LLWCQECIARAGDSDRSAMSAPRWSQDQVEAGAQANPSALGAPRRVAAADLEGGCRGKGLPAVREALMTPAFHRPNSSAACRSSPRSSATSETGVDTRHQPVGLLALAVAHQQPGGLAGQIGQVGARFAARLYHEGFGRALSWYRTSTKPSFRVHEISCLR